MSRGLNSHNTRPRRPVKRYRVTWLQAWERADFEDAKCSAEFEALREAEAFRHWLAAQTTAAVYGVSIDPI